MAVSRNNFRMCDGGALLNVDSSSGAPENHTFVRTASVALDLRASNRKVNRWFAVTLEYAVRRSAPTRNAGTLACISQRTPLEDRRLRWGRAGTRTCSYKERRHPCLHLSENAARRSAATVGTGRHGDLPLQGTQAPLPASLRERRSKIGGYGRHEDLPLQRSKHRI